jgi:hypothetical protein
MSMQALMSLGTELLAAVFGQHIHPILILDFFFWGCLRNKVYNSNPEQKN